MLTSVPWQWANRSKVSDYRWASTPIVTDQSGRVTEVRIGNWLRAPLAAPFDWSKRPTSPIAGSST